MKRMAALLTLLVLPLAHHEVANAQTPSSQKEQTLCNDDEDIYFSCPLENGKTVSVCAKGNATPDRGYVQYRYGSKGAAFAFPPDKFAHAGTIKITDVSEGSIRGLHLKFLKDSYLYVVSSVSPGGVYVLKNGSVIFDEQCKASRYKSFSDKVFDGIKGAPVAKADLH